MQFHFKLCHVLMSLYLSATISGLLNRGQGQCFRLLIQFYPIPSRSDTGALALPFYVQFTYACKTRTLVYIKPV